MHNAAARGMLNEKAEVGFEPTYTNLRFMPLSHLGTRPVDGNGTGSCVGVSDGPAVVLSILLAAIELSGP